MSPPTNSPLALQTSETSPRLSDVPFVQRSLRKLDKSVQQVLEGRKTTGSDAREDNPAPQGITQHHIYGEQSNRNTSDIAGLTPIPIQTVARSSLHATLHPLQEWEGYVVDISSSEFVAHLVDMTSGDSTSVKEETVIPMEEISEYDAKKMHVGSIFRWVIGYERSASGTRRRVSQIVFRDLPVVTKSDLEQSDEWARKTAQSLTL